ncbi:fasciclin domain-containing protein [Cylindrospermum sp. FACHB-282]|uniref:fasciclin domain-containing protein n=1 Tax=Cylindrospermum sp. FACHB-282 TaxID=2692794 RepID=UPI001F55211C|nr:fasciclin domain-containing protein [Cylindrospermum sp. FACHB-282]
MNTNYLTQLPKKVAVITGIIAATAFLSFPLIAQSQPGTTPATPGTTPATPGTTPATPATTATGNLIEVANAIPAFSTLVRAVQAAGLTETLTTGNYTIFAPTDQAFNESLPPGALNFLLQAGNRDLLRQILSYHLISGKVTANELKTGTLDTLNGGVAVRVSPNRIIVNDASIIQSDIPASNGVIHSINRVLLNQKLRDALNSRLGTQEPTPTPTPTPPSR